MKTPIQNLMTKLIESKQISIQNMIDITPFLLEAEKEFKQHIFESYDYGFENTNVSAEQYYNETCN